MSIFGDVEISVAVSDGELSDNEIFILEVLPVNDFPFISSPLEDLDVNEDSNAISINLSDVFDDIDSEQLFYSAEENLSSVQLSIVSDVLLLQFIENLYDSSNIIASKYNTLNKKLAIIF